MYREAIGGLEVQKRDLEETDLVFFETENALAVVFNALKYIKDVIRQKGSLRDPPTRHLQRNLSKVNLEPLGRNRLLSQRDRSMSPARDARPNIRLRDPTPPLSSRFPGFRVLGYRDSRDNAPSTNDSPAPREVIAVYKDQKGYDAIIIKKESNLF